MPLASLPHRALAPEVPDPQEHGCTAGSWTQSVTMEMHPDDCNPDATGKFRAVPIAVGPGWPIKVRSWLECGSPCAPSLLFVETCLLALLFRDGTNGKGSTSGRARLPVVPLSADQNEPALAAGGGPPSATRPEASSRRPALSPAGRGISRQANHRRTMRHPPNYRIAL